MLKSQDIMTPIQTNPNYRLKQISPNLIEKVGQKAIAEADLLHRLLYLRNIDDESKANFMEPDFENGFHDPFLLKDMNKTVTRILKAIDDNETILVYSDFDADGLPGSAILHDFFRKISYPHVIYFRPDRHNEGFGLHAHILDQFLDKNISLIITIDCGIADCKPVEEINKKFKEINKEIDIIITDHHLPGPDLPKVFSIVNPKQDGCNYPEKMLCGAAVIYKVVCALVSKLREKTKNDSEDSKDVFGKGYEKWLLDLVGLSTLSDMVPLLGENRLLAYYGLIVMRKSKRPGFQALAKVNRIALSGITEDDITFTFSPRINVASRLADASIAFELLTTDSFDQAMSVAKELDSINNKRKTMVAQITKQAHAAIKDKNLHDDNVLVLGNPDWKPPVLGLVATSLSKSYKKPVFIWGRSTDGAYKGSVRGNGTIDIVKIMHHMADEIFINRGGHTEAGGFTINPDRIYGFHQAVNKSFNHLNSETNISDDNTDVIEQDKRLHHVDAELNLSFLKPESIKILEKLSPYGMNNDKPLFAFPNCTIISTNMFGKEKNHLEIICTDESVDYLRKIKGIQFFYEGEDISRFQKVEAIDQKYTLIGHIEKNQFMGANDIRLRLIDIC